MKNTYYCFIVGVLASVSAHAGISEPGILLYGKVLNGSGALVTSGSVTWTYTPVASGAAVSVTGNLGDVVAPDGTHYSYAVQVPLETAVSGLPVASSALGIDQTTPAYYTRTATVSALGITNTRKVPIDYKDRLSAERVDLCVNGDCKDLADFHMSDLNRDGKFSLTEMLLFLAYFNASDTHDYQCGVGPDGFGYGAPGGGAKPCSRHSADYDATAWQYSLSEALTLIAHFNASPCHAYYPSGATTDGFSDDPGSCNGGTSKSLGGEVSGVPGAMTMVRTVTGAVEGQYRYLYLTIVYEYADGSPFTALGIEDYLPPRWSVVETTAGSPYLSPKAGVEGLAEFGWFQLPASSGALTYKVDVSSDEDLVSALRDLYGIGLYHVQGIDGEFQVLIENLGGADAQDLDGDGIPDALEGNYGNGDADGDGIPNMIDPDSNNDGVSDSAEGTGDTNGNGVPDVYEPKAALPIPQWAFALLVLALSVPALAGLRRGKAAR